jgi:hypothetical protein
LNTLNFGLRRSSLTIARKNFIQFIFEFFKIGPVHNPLTMVKYSELISPWSHTDKVGIAFELLRVDAAAVAGAGGFETVAGE